MADVSIAQNSLARAVSRARAGEDAELSRKVREAGESLSKLLAGVLRLKRLHGADNQAFETPVAELTRAVGELVDTLGTVHIVAVEEQVYVNDIRIPTESGAGKALAAELAAHNTGGLTFHGAITPENVRAAIAVFGGAPATEAPRHTAQRALADRGVKRVELTPRVKFIQEDDAVATVRDPVETLRRLLGAVEETYDNVGAGRILNVLPLRRAIAEILDVGLDTPALWETIGEGPPHASHAVEVALVVLLVGKGAGLRLGFLQDLGLAGLTHDVGYAALSGTVPPTDALALHPVEAARVMLRQRGFHVAKLRRLRAILDHHRAAPAAGAAASPLGDLLRMAEDYATLVRVHAARVSRADAVGAIAHGAGRLYDPALAQLLVNALGRYPPGTLVELADGRIARSCSPARSDRAFATPIVRLVDPRTRAFAAERLDLAQGGPAIVRALPG